MAATVSAKRLRLTLRQKTRRPLVCGVAVVLGPVVLVNVLPRILVQVAVVLLPPLLQLQRLLLLVNLRPIQPQLQQNPQPLPSLPRHLNSLLAIILA